MLQIVCHQTVQRALRQCRQLSTRAYTRYTQLQYRSFAGQRQMSTTQSKSLSDGMLIAAGIGVLGATCAFGYLATNTQYTPESPSIIQKISEEVQEITETIETITEEEAVTVENVAATDDQTPVPEEVTDQNPQETPVEETLLVDVVDEKPEKAAITIEPAPTESAPTEAVLSEPALTEPIQIEPLLVRKFPESAPYIIIGAGTSAYAACRAIRKREPNAKILIIGEENALPYMRPPLSKELWFTDSPDIAETLVFKSWNGKERSVYFEDSEYYTKPEDLTNMQNGGVAVITGERVSGINAESHEISLASGETVKYGKLLLATGGKPKDHVAFKDAGEDVKKRTTLFRSIADFQSLSSAVRDSQHVTVIGGGFLGSELACALAAQGKTSGLKVTQIYPEEGNMAKVLPKYLSDWTTRKVTKEGVDIILKSSVKEVRYENDQVQLQLDNGDVSTADHVVVCVGLQPNVELASSAGLEIDSQEGGFRVNSELEARSDIWVAGDAACFYDINLGRRRVEHHDHAVVSGRLAGENMTGAKKSYKHQSMFWSDLGPDVGYEAIGICDSTLPTVGIWAKATESDTPKAAEEASGESIRSESEAVVDGESTTPATTDTTTTATSKQTEHEESFGKGVVFYMKEKKVVGVLLWNIFSQMPVARKIITEAKDHEDLNALAKLFKIH